MANAKRKSKSTVAGKRDKARRPAKHPHQAGAESIAGVAGGAGVSVPDGGQQASGAAPGPAVPDRGPDHRRRGRNAPLTQPHANTRFMTGLGLALATQNDVTAKALKAAGHVMQKPGPASRSVDPFCHEPAFARRLASMGETLAGADGKAPILWPDMKALDEKVKAERKPMPEEVKEKLRERAKANPKDKGDEVAIMLRDCATLDDVYAKAAEYIGEKADEMKAKYAKLNPGQQRMVLGNRMRAKWKTLHLKAGTREGQ